MASRKKKDTKEEIAEEQLEDSTKVEEGQDAESDEQEEEEVDPIEKLEAELTEKNDKFLRLLAEFENYKRRTAKERMDLMKTAGKDIIIDLLPIMDDFERGMVSTAEMDDAQAVKDGMQLIYNKFSSFLTSKGCKSIESKGEDFDTDLHEAISRMPVEGDDQKNKIIDEIEKGYKLNDQLIRFSKVVVGV